MLSFVLLGLSPLIAAAEMALLSNIEVVLSPIIVWAFLGETASANTFIGRAVLLAVTVNGIIGARRAAGGGGIGGAREFNPRP